MGIPADSLANATNAIHQRMNPFFLEKGLMFGEFFANNKKPGLRNADFHTLQSPLPLLVIRDMLPMDIVFLAEKPEFSQMYKLKFGPHFPKEIFDQLGNLNKRFTDPYTVNTIQYLMALNASNDQKAGKDPVAGLLDGPD